MSKTSLMLCLLVLAYSPVTGQGGFEWQKTKSRIKKSMRVLAEDLLKLYAQREVSRGHAFAPDDELMREFEEAFEFDATIDQQFAIEATKGDILQMIDALISHINTLI